ncbi:hypothetical protein O4U30_24740 (plasmid) [Enterobacter hormaechei subsp. xiangfangensis]|uniref:hypothetical protein n=1 Tax=Enterobacter hormaechei TaxID=158836 RepID=UPI0028744612|nr:hypothetical protein [Enterobacter hormaechei]MDR9998040.1 hypothetical protein [Enterobacter hormaechei subsp. xiangfangensis]
MNINFEYLNGNKTIGLFFLRSEAVIPDRFKNLILLIDGLSFGTFGFHPHEGFEDELISVSYTHLTLPTTSRV